MKVLVIGPVAEHALVWKIAQVLKSRDFVPRATGVLLPGPLCAY